MSDEVGSATRMAEAMGFSARGNPESVQSIMSLVFEPWRMPDLATIAELPRDKREQIFDWCGDVHLAAGDHDDVVPGPIPDFLNAILKIPWGEQLPPGTKTNIWDEVVDE